MDVHDARLRALAGTLALILAACGGEAPADAAASATPSRLPLNDYTAAVPVGDAPAAASLEFKLAGSPHPGRPAVVSLKVTPKGDAPQLALQIVGEDGLALASTQEPQISLGPVASAKPQTRDVMVVPAHDGVFLLKVAVTTDGTATRRGEFAVPVLVPAEAAAPAAPAPAADGG